VWTILGWILERWDGMDWIDLARGGDRWRALGIWDSIKCWEVLSGCTIGGFSRRAQLRE
jgi:hypothetical protein